MSTPTNIQNLRMTMTKRNDTGAPDIWLHFNSAAGATASISVAALAERSGPIVRRALIEWASDRCGDIEAEAVADDDARRDEENNGQFGVGA